MEDVIPNAPSVIAMTNLGYIKRMSVSNFKSQHRGGKGIKGMQTLDEDYIEDLLMTMTHNSIMCFTNMGKVYRLKVYEIPEASRTARGTAIVNLIQLTPGEKVTAILPGKQFREGYYLFMATKQGMVKKTPLRDFENMRKTGLTAIHLKEGDELIEVKYTDSQKDVLMITRKGMCIRFHESDVRPTGRTSMGVIGMKLDLGDEIIGMQLDSQGDTLLTVSEKGLGKRTYVDEFVPQNRGGKGVKCYKINSRTGELIGAKAVKEEQEVMLITTEGIIIRFNVEDISILGRITSGVKLIDMENKVTVASIAKVRDGSAKETNEQVLKKLESEAEK